MCVLCSAASYTLQPIRPNRIISAEYTTTACGAKAKRKTFLVIKTAANYLRSKYLLLCDNDDIAIYFDNKRRQKLYGVIKTGLIFMLLSAPLLAISNEAQAAGDAGAGAKIFEQCGACHSAKQGENVVGPSLYGVIGRPAGSVDGFDYSKAMTEAAKKGLSWTPENIINYLQNPRKYLDDFASDPGAPNKMTFSLADQKQRE